VIGILAGRCNTVVATGAGAQYLEVVDCHRRVPYVGTVTVFTDVGGADVIERFSSSGHAIVAVTTALSSNILVIEVGG